MVFLLRLLASTPVRRLAVLALTTRGGRRVLRKLFGALTRRRVPQAAGRAARP